MDRRIRSQLSNVGYGKVMLATRTVRMLISYFIDFAQGMGCRSAAGVHILRSPGAFGVLTKVERAHPHSSGSPQGMVTPYSLGSCAFPSLCQHLFWVA